MHTTYVSHLLRIRIKGFAALSSGCGLNVGPWLQVSTCNSRQVAAPVPIWIHSESEMADGKPNNSCTHRISLSIYNMGTQFSSLGMILIWAPYLNIHFDVPAFFSM